MRNTSLIQLLEAGLKKKPLLLAPVVLALHDDELEQILPVYLYVLRRSLKTSRDLAGILSLARRTWPDRISSLGLTGTDLSRFWFHCQLLGEDGQLPSALVIALNEFLNFPREVQDLPLGSLSAYDWLYWELGCPEIQPVNPWLKLAVSKKELSQRAANQLAFRCNDLDLNRLLRALPFVSPWYPADAKPSFHSGQLVSPNDSCLTNRMSAVSFAKAAGENYSHLANALRIQAFPAIRILGVEVEILLGVSSETRVPELVVSNLLSIPEFDRAVLHLDDGSTLSLVPGQTVPIIEQSSYMTLQITAGGMDYDFVLMP